jgi:hypothetical protein
MKLENAKKIPPTSPEPSADTTIRIDFKSDISWGLILFRKGVPGSSSLQPSHWRRRNTKVT